MFSPNDGSHPDTNPNPRDFAASRPRKVGALPGRPIPCFPMGEAEILTGDQQSVAEWTRYVGKETNYSIFSDLARSSVSLVAMLADVCVIIVELEPHAGLYMKASV